VTWYIIAPNVRITFQWLRHHHPDVNPNSKDLRIVTPGTADRLRGCQFREGDRLTRLNAHWDANSAGMRQIERNLDHMNHAGLLPTCEWVTW
jgi:hypothetical protein